MWRTARDASVGWGTPIAIRVGDHDEIIVNSQSRVIAYNPDTGRELWRCGGTTFEVIPTPVVGYGLVFCSSGRAGPTLAIRPGGTGDVTAHARRVDDAARVAVRAVADPRRRPSLHGQRHAEHRHLLRGARPARRCGRAASAWRSAKASRRRRSSVDGKVFFTNDDGETFVLRAGATFELLHVNDIGERTLASPALVDGRWYIRTEAHLIAIGA